MRNKKEVKKKVSKFDICFTVSQLKERGWTQSMINKLLLDHDDSHKMYRRPHPMKLYKKSRVFAFERNKRFKDLLAKSLVRIEAGKKSVVKAEETRRLNQLIKEAQLAEKKLDAQCEQREQLEYAREQFVKIQNDILKQTEHVSEGGKKHIRNELLEIVGLYDELEIDIENDDCHVKFIQYYQWTIVPELCEKLVS